MADLSGQFPVTPPGFQSPASPPFANGPFGFPANVPVPNAPYLVASASNPSSATSVAIPVRAPTGRGDALVLVCSAAFGGGVPVSCTDTKGNSYGLASFSNQGQGVMWYVAQNTVPLTAADSITVTMALAGHMLAVVTGVPAALIGAAPYLAPDLAGVNGSAAVPAGVMSVTPVPVAAAPGVPEVIIAGQVWNPAGTGAPPAFRPDFTVVASTGQLTAASSAIVVAWKAARQGIAPGSTVVQTLTGNTSAGNQLAYVTLRAETRFARAPDMPPGWLSPGAWQYQPGFPPSGVGAPSYPGSVTAGVTLTPSCTGSGQRRGAAAAGVTMALSAAGGTSGSAAAGVTMALSAAGASQRSQAAGGGLGFAPSAAGGEGGSAAAGVTLAGSAAGAGVRAGAGPAGVTLVLSCTGFVVRAGTAATGAALAPSAAGAGQRSGLCPAAVHLAASSAGAGQRSGPVTAGVTLAPSAAGGAAGITAAGVTLTSSALGAGQRHGSPAGGAHLVPAGTGGSQRHGSVPAGAYLAPSAAGAGQRHGSVPAGAVFIPSAAGTCVRRGSAATGAALTPSAAGGVAGAVASGVTLAPSAAGGSQRAGSVTSRAVLSPSAAGASRRAGTPAVILHLAPPAAGYSARNGSAPAGVTLAPSATGVAVGTSGTVTWTARPAPARWHASPAAPRWRAVMTAFTPIAAVSLAEVNITWTSELFGTVIDPTGQSPGTVLLPVLMAFPVSSGNPLTPAPAVTWYTASWLLGSTAAGYTSQCLVGPGGVIMLTAGVYDCWGQIQGTPEIPKIFAGTQTVY